MRLVGAIARDDSKLAAELYPNLLPDRQTWSPVVRLIGIDRLFALAAETAGDLEMAQKHFDESISFCKKAGMLPELAWTYHDYVEFLLARPGRVDRPNAIQMIDDGQAITEKLGMMPLGNRLTGLRGEVDSIGEVP